MSLARDADEERGPGCIVFCLSGSWKSFTTPWSVAFAKLSCDCIPDTGHVENDNLGSSTTLVKVIKHMI